MHLCLFMDFTGEKFGRFCNGVFMVEFGGGEGQISGHLKKKWCQVCLELCEITHAGSQKCLNDYIHWNNLKCHTALIADYCNTYSFFSAAIRNFLNKGEINLQMV